MSRQIYRFLSRPLIADVALAADRPGMFRINSKSLRIAVLLTVLALLNGVDLLYTLFAHQVGMLGEMNPIAAGFLSHNQEATLIGYKILCTFIAMAIFWKARKSPWTPPACWLVIAIYLGLAVLWMVWMQAFNEAAHSQLSVMLASR